MSRQKIKQLTEAEQIVLSALLEEAEYKVRKKVKSGKEQKDAIKEVSDDMELNDLESDALVDIFDKPEVPLSTPDNPYPNSIYFNDPADINSAVGLLMYNNIPWNAKGSDDNTQYIQFSDQDSLAKAMTALGRKWDFINNKQDNVATISFDNINDYKKVMDFITKSGMFINFNNETNLDEDINQLEKEKVVDHSGRSFKAASKKLKEKIDPVRNKDQRSMVVRKRFR